MPTLLVRLWKKALPPDRQKEEGPKKDEQSAEPASPYTEEEARKVKERLQGLGYIE